MRPTFNKCGKGIRRTESQGKKVGHNLYAAVYNPSKRYDHW